MQRQNTGKFIVVGLATGTAKERAELEDALQQEFGNKFLNLRQSLCEEGMDRAGIKSTQEDEKRIASGSVPISLMYDEVHFNQYGYQVIAELLYERIIQLGYMDGIKDDALLYGNRWRW